MTDAGRAGSENDEEHGGRLHTFTDRERCELADGTLKAPVIVGFLVFGVLSVVAAVLAVVFTPFLDTNSAESDLVVAAPVTASSIVSRPQYFPPRPADAPETIRAQVLRGQAILRARTLPGASYRRLACSSCHFDAGLSDGGKNGGISLVGAAAASGVEGSALTVSEHIADCYKKNLHMPAPQQVDSVVRDMDYYLRWLSQGIPFLSVVPWLKPVPLSSSHVPDSNAGAQTWRNICSACHGEHGEGTRIAPATYGPDSFTKQSQILAPGVLERFIKDNMPRGNPTLSDADAIDVAAYVRKQDRPVALGD